MNYNIGESKPTAIVFCHD